MVSREPDPQSLAELLMLEKIDKHLACGVGELIQKPLPRDSGLCTRFATQIVFRREFH
jgi:hypothetical protein